MKKNAQGFFGDFKPGKPQENKTTPAASVPATLAPTQAPTGGKGMFTDTPNTKTTVPTDTSTPSAQKSISSGPVAAMQEQLIKLYNTLKSKPEIAEWFSREQESKPGTSEFRKTPDPFLQLMLNRYVGKAKQQGQQYDLSMPDAKTYSALGKQLPKSSFLQYMAMLSVVGQHTTTDNVRSPDGNWGAYTDNAIKACWSIAYAMTTLSQKLGERFRFTQAHLDAFRQFIPDNIDELKKLNQNERSKLAAKITPFISELIKSVSDFVAVMTDASHKYSQYISAGKSFNILKNDGKSSLSEPEQNASKQLAQSGSAVPNVFMIGDLSGESEDKYPISFNDISSIANFTQYLASNKIKVKGMDASKGDGVRVAINYLKRQIQLARNAQSKPTSSDTTGAGY